MKFKMLTLFLTLFLGFGCAEEEDETAARSSASNSGEELSCMLENDSGDFYCMDYSDLEGITEDIAAELCESFENTPGETLTSCPDQDENEVAADGTCEGLTPPEESGYTGTFDQVSYGNSDAESDCASDGGTWVAADDSGDSEAGYSGSLATPSISYDCGSSGCGATVKSSLDSASMPLLFIQYSSESCDTSGLDFITDYAAFFSSPSEHVLAFGIAMADDNGDQTVTGSILGFTDEFMGGDAVTSLSGAQSEIVLLPYSDYFYCRDLTSSSSISSSLSVSDSDFTEDATP